ncbi:MAG: hypothetical protein HDR17_11310 [Lachnospiraceae bacterium]|nr:hypothetical protein [Lachnospiraceae bacterium]
MKLKKNKKKVHKILAWTLTVACLLPSAEKLGNNFMDVQAKEEVAEGYNDAVTYNDMIEGGNVLSLGYHHSAAIKSDGSLWMWGGNLNGGLGIGDESLKYSNKPIRVMDNVRFVSVGGGGTGSAAITMDNNLWL